MADITTALTTGTRYLHGETNPIDAYIAVDKAVKIGDLLGMDGLTGSVKSATDYGAVAGFMADFVGISGQTKDAGVEQIRGNSRKCQIRVDTDGVFEMPCADTVKVGDLVGPKLNGGKVTAQELVKAADAASAVGYVVEANPDPTTSNRSTTVKFRLVPKKLGILACK